MAENKENYKPEWTPDGAGSEFASSVMPGIEGSGVQETAPRPFSRKQMSVEEYVHGVLSGNRRTVNGLNGSLDGLSCFQVCHCAPSILMECDIFHSLISFYLPQ